MFQISSDCDFKACQQKDNSLVSIGVFEAEGLRLLNQGTWHAVSLLALFQAELAETDHQNNR